MGQTKVPREVWNAIQDGPVQIQIDENRGVIWVNSGKDGHCLIRICNIPNLSEMMDRPRGLWCIDVRAANGLGRCAICGYKVKTAPPWDRRDATAVNVGGGIVCGTCRMDIKDHE